MSKYILSGCLFVCLTSGLFSAEEPITVKTDVSKTQTAWTVPPAKAVREEFGRWLDAAVPDNEELRRKILSTWPESSGTLSGEQLFQRTIESMRLASTPVSTYLEACDRLAWKELPFGQTIPVPQVPLQALLGEENSTAYLLGSLRFYLALRLVQARLYDEAATVLDQLTPENSVDPCGVLLTRAVVCCQLGDQEKGIQAITRFRKAVENDPLVPRRHLELAKLLEADLKNSKDAENPSNISRKMDDVRRRLGKGRTGEGTQESERDVMKSLDKLIEKIEQKMKQRQSGEGEGQQANKPADDSRILKQKGPGNVDRKEFDPKGNWGDLPPKEREEALLRIEKEFPAHYRDIIEQYFREMAEKTE